MNVKSELLATLANSDGKYISGAALADKLGVSRQAVAKWESGQIYPDISNLIQISDLMSVSVDYLVKDRDCAVNIIVQSNTDIDELISFRLSTSTISPARLSISSGSPARRATCIP